MRLGGSKEENYELQFQHEENMIVYQTEKRRSKQRKDSGNLFSPDDSNHDADNNSRNGSPQANSKSKGSPNYEKNKQLYRNLLAQ